MNKYHGHYANAQDSKPSWTPKPYSQNQANLIKKLLADKGISQELLLQVFPSRPTTFADGSKVIAWLIAQPKVVPAVPSQPSSVQGMAKLAGVAPVEYGEDGQAKKAHAYHYALEEDGDVKFYRVKRGRKEGVFFIDAQASDDYFAIRNPTRKALILKAIAEDPKAALARYGQQLGRCGRCLKTLTSEYRELGIGPVCIDK